MYWKLSIEASNEKRRDRRLIWLIKLKHILIRRKQISETWIQYIVFCIFIPVLHMGIALTYENKQKVGSIVTKIQQSFFKRVKKMKGLKLNIYSKCGAQSIVHCTNNDIQKFSWDFRKIFFFCSLAWLRADSSWYWDNIPDPWGRVSVPESPDQESLLGS